MYAVVFAVSLIFGSEFAIASGVVLSWLLTLVVSFGEATEVCVLRVQRPEFVSSIALDMPRGRFTSVLISVPLDKRVFDLFACMRPGVHSAAVVDLCNYGPNYIVHDRIGTATIAILEIRSNIIFASCDKIKVPMLLIGYLLAHLRCPGIVRADVRSRGTDIVQAKGGRAELFPR